MKGIVVERNDDKCVLLLSDGTFRTVKTTDEPQIGTVLYINAQHSAAFCLKKTASMVAAMLIVAFLGWGAYSWTIPVQYINIDINPSVELAVNRYDRIIRMTPLNDDGERLLASVHLQMQKVDKGVHTVIETAKDLGYLADEKDVLISVSSSDSELSQKTQEEIKNKVTQEAEVLVFNSTEHEQSVHDGLSPGKKHIIGKVIESGTNLTEEELATVPVKDLMLRVKENKKIEKELEKEAKQQEKQRKKTEKAERKQNGRTTGDQNGKQGDQGTVGKKAGNTETPNVKQKGNNNPGNRKQPDRDSAKKEDKMKESKENDRTTGNSGTANQSSAKMEKEKVNNNGKQTGRDSPKKEDKNKEIKGNDKTTGNSSNGVQSVDDREKGKEKTAGNPSSGDKEKEKEKNKGDQSADKKDDIKDKAKQKDDANFEKSSNRVIIIQSRN